MNTMSCRFGVLHLGEKEVSIDQLMVVRTVRDTLQISIGFREDMGINTLPSELVIELSEDRASDLSGEIQACGY